MSAIVSINIYTYHVNKNSPGIFLGCLMKMTE